MIDFHCHLDLYKEPMCIFDEVKKRGDFVLTVTTSPKAYVMTSRYFVGAKNIQVALGFYPELVAQRIQEKDVFFREMHNSPYIGEIGIDGSKRNMSSYEMQMNFFEQTISMSEDLGGRILSIHSRGASKEVLRILEEHVIKSIPVLHWFTGTVGQARKAVSLGYMFSINPNMCLTSGGKKIVDEIPITQMLPETDAPFTQNRGMPYMPWDDTVIKYLSSLYDEDSNVILKKMEVNLNRIRRYAEELK